MNEARTTGVFGAVALLLALAAWAATPRVTVPDVFGDRGELFFPQLTDPNAASSLEVTEFDEQNGAVRPFKVLNRDGRWTIPSHFDYPTDAKDRLGQTTSALIALRKDDFASDNAADHERLGVLDPLDPALPSLRGRGTRVVLRGANEQPLADIIIGNPAPTRADFRYVRVPGQKRVYLSRLGDLKLSASFSDWIERDLLQVDREDIDEIAIRNYSFDETTGDQTMRETLLLQKKGDDFALSSLTSGEAMNRAALNLLLTKLVDLKIVGVLPKPAGITATLTRPAAGSPVAQADVQDLGRKGFYLTREGQLLSNEGEMVVHTRSGIFYTLRFGQVAPGTFETAPPVSGASNAGATPAAPVEHRYLFIMAAFDASSVTPPGRSTVEAERRTLLLRARFAPWYYVISADDFSTIRVRRADLVQKKS
ncbi:MAG: DUF4340 domain-containing protein [Acidobacteria bacterium]|nr:DUF4340 domain-containing protein [Acidobacteriota bacterium]